MELAWFSHQRSPKELIYSHLPKRDLQRRYTGRSVYGYNMRYNWISFRWNSTWRKKKWSWKLLRWIHFISRSNFHEKTCAFRYSSSNTIGRRRYSFGELLEGEVTLRLHKYKCVRETSVERARAFSQSIYTRRRRNQTSFSLFVVAISFPNG